MNETDFEVGGRKFKLRKMDTFKQFHVVRRLGPILGDIIPMAKELKGMKETSSEEEKFDVIAKLAKPIMDGLSSLSDDDANKVLLALLSCAEMQQLPAGNWAQIAKGEVLLIQDLDLPAVMQIAGRAFAFNLASFFTSANQISHGGK